LVDHCPRCHVSLLPDSDFCDRCGLPLSPSAAFGWAAGTARSSDDDEKFDERSRFGAPTAPTDATSVADSTAPVPTEQQKSSPKTARLDRYMPEELREKLDAARSAGEMVGERRIVTMLFCDVKGSTAAAENLDPEEWTEIMNGAFEHMIRPVYKYEGTVARLMGDGILAFFGAPITHEDDAQRAVLAGLEIVDGVSGYREQTNHSWGVDINVRVGINTGLVVVGTVGSDLRMEYSAMGDAINLAARMEQTAGPGAVQIAHDTYRVVKPFFEIEDLGEITVKGKADPVPVYQVLARRAGAGRQHEIAGLQATLVGRDRELTNLKNAFARVQQGVGSIVSVIGEAGLGKSRLIYEARRTLGPSQSADWIETTSLSYEKNRPYAPFQRLIRRLGNMSPVDSPQQVREKLADLCRQLVKPDRQRAQRVFATLFNLESNDDQRLEGEAFKRELYQIMPSLWRRRFARRPTVLVFEDLHWSDPASFDLLLHLFPLTAELPLVLLCAFRADRTGPVWQIETTADEQFHHLYTEIIVRPLSDRQVDELIDGLLVDKDIPDSVRAHITESAAGNPFFVEEVVRSLIDNQALFAKESEQATQELRYAHATGNDRHIEIPNSLQSLLSSRIDRLEEDTRQLLQTAAVIGRSFYRRVLEAIELQDRQAIQAVERQLNVLLRLEMIQEAARLPELEYRFSNPLTQEVAYQTILLKRRRKLHRRVGQTLEELFPDQLGELAPLLAYHFHEGNLPGKAFDYYLLAGDSAARLFANIEAVAHYTRALELTERANPDHEKLKAVYAGRGRALELLSRYEESLQNYESMLQLARDRNDKRLELAATMSQATIRSIPSKVFDPQISLQLSKDAQNLARELGDSSAEAKIHWNLMLHYQWAALQFDQAAEHGEAAVEAARNSGVAAELGPILNDLALVYFGVGRLEESLRALEESRGILRSSNDLPLLALNLTSSSSVHFLIGNNELSQTFVQQAEKIDRSIDNAWGLAGIQYSRGCMQLVAGRWGDALQDLDRCVQFAEKAQSHMLLGAAMVAKANYYFAVGATETALTHCRQTIDLFEEHWQNMLGYPWGILSLLYLLSGDEASAREALEFSLANFNLNVPPAPTLSAIEVRLAELRFRIVDGRPDLALAVADDLLDYLQRFHVKQFRDNALMLKAQALLELNRQEEANELLNEACRLAEELSAQPILWQIYDLQADALERFGDPDQATAKREQARAIITALAGTIRDETDRSTFLNLPHVRRLSETGRA
jgi:predicted ATPase/class 3 adenylate cyclase